MIITKVIQDDSIILSMEMNFSNWLQGEIDRRGWSWNKLAERAGLSSGTIYNIQYGTRGVGKKSLQGIAKALQLPEETVYSKAAFIVTNKADSELAKEAILIFNHLPPEKQKEAIDFLRYISTGG